MQLLNLMLVFPYVKCTHAVSPAALTPSNVPDSYIDTRRSTLGQVCMHGWENHDLEIKIKEI